MTFYFKFPNLNIFYHYIVVPSLSVFKKNKHFKYTLGEIKYIVLLDLFPHKISALTYLIAAFYNFNSFFNALQIFQTPKVASKLY